MQIMKKFVLLALLFHPLLIASTYKSEISLRSADTWGAIRENRDERYYNQGPNLRNQGPNLRSADTWGAVRENRDERFYNQGRNYGNYRNYGGNYGGYGGYRSYGGTVVYPAGYYPVGGYLYPDPVNPSQNEADAIYRANQHR